MQNSSIWPVFYHFPLSKERKHDHCKVRCSMQCLSLYREPSHYKRNANSQTNKNLQPLKTIVKRQVKMHVKERTNKKESKSVHSCAWEDLRWERMTSQNFCNESLWCSTTTSKRRRNFSLSLLSIRRLFLVSDGLRFSHSWLPLYPCGDQ